MANYEVHVFRIYYLRIFPLWGEDSESVELGKNLEEIIKKIVSEKSISGFIGKEKRPFRFCQVEEEEAVFLVQYGKTFFGKERSPVWKVIVPRSVIYSREMIMSCISRGGGSNVEKYKNALCEHQKTSDFFTHPNGEIRPVEDSVFVIENTSK